VEAVTDVAGDPAPISGSHAQIPLMFALSIELRPAIVVPALADIAATVPLQKPPKRPVL
jgi:hypothetical protein